MSIFIHIGVYPNPKFSVFFPFTKLPESAFSRLCTLHSKEGEQNRIIIRSVQCEMNHFSTIIIRNHQQCFHRHTSRHQQCLGLVTLLWKTSNALMDSLCWRFVHSGVHVCMCEVNKKGPVSSVLLPGGRWTSKKLLGFLWFFMV